MPGHLVRDTRASLARALGHAGRLTRRYASGAPPAPLEASASRRRQGPPPPVPRHPRYPEPLSDLPVAGPGLDQFRRLKPQLLPPGTPRSGQPAAIGIPHDTGIPRSASDDQRP
jgi:hypothetical protein